MKKDQLKKNEGHRVQLDPPAIGPRGEVLDGDWTIRTVRDDAAELAQVDDGVVAIIGLDHIYTYFSDPPRSAVIGSPCGLLQLHSQVRIHPDGHVSVRPLPPPRVGLRQARPVPNPLVVRVGAEDRHFSWRGRGDDAVYLIEQEEAPRQLLDSFRAVCDALRADSGREPEFNLTTDIRGEIIYELSADQRARWQLLGGMGGRPAQQVLVLTDRRAQVREAPIHTNAPPETKWVHLSYPADTGLQQRLEAEGFTVGWSREDNVRNGKEIVVVEDAGRRITPSIRPGPDGITLVLTKRRRA